MPRSPRFPACLAAGLLAAALAGCQSPQTVDQRIVQSEVLMAPMGEILADAVLARRKAGADLPEDYKSSGYAQSVLETVRLQYPDVFMVPAEREAAWRQGRFDNEANRKRMDALLKRLKGSSVSLNTITQYLVTEHRQNGLEGVRLVLAKRLLRAQLEAAGVGEQQAEASADESGS